LDGEGAVGRWPELRAECHAAEVEVEVEVLDLSDYDALLGVDSGVASGYQHTFNDKDRGS
jgi:hypothetical protein